MLFSSSPSRKHPVVSGHLLLLLTFFGLRSGWTLPDPTTLFSGKARVSSPGQTRQSSDLGAAGVILSLCLRDSCEDVQICEDVVDWCSVLFCPFFLQKEHAFETDPEQHRFKSLPLMNNRASDINSLEVNVFYVVCVCLSAFQMCSVMSQTLILNLSLSSHPPFSPPDETHSLSAPRGLEVVWAPFCLVEQSIKETPPPCSP